MLLKFAMLIFLIVSLYYFKVNNWLLLSILFASGTVYFIKERQKRAESLNFLTLLLALAATVLGGLKGIGSPGVFYLALAAVFTPLLSFKAKGVKRAVLIAPFWLFTALAVGDIFSVRYPSWGYLLSLIIIPIYLRDLKLNEYGVEGDEIQKTE